jgi:hypothetical protein
MCPSVERIRKFDVFICWNYSGASCQSLVGCVQSQSFEHVELLDYYRHQLDLLAQMCQEQQVGLSTRNNPIIIL